jgi:hypothetical protein
MLAIIVMVVALAAGGAAAAGLLSPWIHGGLMVLAWGLNARSLWVSYRTVSENVRTIHQINRLMESQASASPVKSAPGEEISGSYPVPSSEPLRSFPSRYYFLALAVWVPYLYMRWSLGDRVFPLWPFVLLSLGLGTLGFWLSFGQRKKG